MVLIDVRCQYCGTVQKKEKDQRDIDCVKCGKRNVFMVQPTERPVGRGR